MVASRWTSAEVKGPYFREWARASMTSGLRISVRRLLALGSGAIQAWTIGGVPPGVGLGEGKER